MVNEISDCTLWFCNDFDGAGNRFITNKMYVIIYGRSGTYIQQKKMLIIYFTVNIWGFCNVMLWEILSFNGIFVIIPQALGDTDEYVLYLCWKSKVKIELNYATCLSLCVLCNIFLTNFEVFNKTAVFITTIFTRCSYFLLFFMNNNSSSDMILEFLIKI